MDEDWVIKSLDLGISNVWYFGYTPLYLLRLPLNPAHLFFLIYEYYLCLSTLPNAGLLPCDCCHCIRITKPSWLERMSLRLWRYNTRCASVRMRPACELDATSCGCSILSLDFYSAIIWIHPTPYERPPPLLRTAFAFNVALQEVIALSE